MHTPTFSLATTILLAAASLVFADPQAEPQEAPPTEVISPSPPEGEIPATEIEKIRQQLGPEFSIESEELEITFDRPETSGAKPSHLRDASTKGNVLEKELHALAEGTRGQARHLEELASQAEVEMQYALADNLRELARQKWQMARILSKPVVDLKHPLKSRPNQVALPQPYSPPSPPTAFISPVPGAPGTVFPASSPQPWREADSR